VFTKLVTYERTNRVGCAHLCSLLSSEIFRNKTENCDRKFYDTSSQLHNKSSRFFAIRSPFHSDDIL